MSRFSTMNLLAWMSASLPLLVFAAGPALAQSNSVLDRVRERASSRAESQTETKANERVDSAVDKTVDCVFNPIECAKQQQATTPDASVEAAPSATDTAEWYAESQGQRVGPMQKTQLATMAAEGKLTPETLVWHEGLSGWTPAGKLSELGDVFKKAPPPLPSRPSGPPPLPSR